mmetsp:Transcript_20981/g.69980  ORF Transcript_20981/g.69980 Transcript_20981/m.69980 type:complete len:203 (+) Transcript_20981:1104-1712(+)
MVHAVQHQVQEPTHRASSKLSHIYARSVPPVAGSLAGNRKDGVRNAGTKISCWVHGGVDVASESENEDEDPRADKSRDDDIGVDCSLLRRHHVSLLCHHQVAPSQEGCGSEFLDGIEEEVGDGWSRSERGKLDSLICMQSLGIFLIELCHLLCYLSLDRLFINLCVQNQTLVHRLVLIKIVHIVVAALPIGIKFELSLAACL